MCCKIPSSYSGRALWDEGLTDTLALGRMERCHSFYLTCSVKYKFSSLLLLNPERFYGSLLTCLCQCTLPGMAGGDVVQFWSVPLISVVNLKKKKKAFCLWFTSDISHEILDQVFCAHSTESSQICRQDVEVFDCILRIYINLLTYLHWTRRIIRYAVVAMHCGKKYLEEAGMMHAEDLFWMSLKSWDLVTLDLALVHIMY